MKICLDARGNHFGGVLTYSYSIIKAFSELDTDHKFVVLLDEYQEKEKLFIINNMKKIVAPEMGPAKMLYWNNWALPILLKENNIDVYHGFKHFTLSGAGAKLIFSLRSASWWVYPKLFKKSELYFWRTYYALGAQRVNLILTTSEFDKNIFIKNHRINPDKVKSIHQAPDGRFTKITNQERLKQAKEKYKLPDRYILFVGTIYPFKNIETVIAAFGIAKKKGVLPHKLVLVGGNSSAYGSKYRPQLEALARKNSLDKDIIWTGVVFDELPEIYSMADLFLFPSLYESYTKPPIEAMACGTPSIVSNEGGLPEVVGDAAVIKGCKDVDGIATSVLDILGSNELRQDLIERGLKRAATFSWEKCVNETLAAYENLFRVETFS